MCVCFSCLLYSHSITIVYITKISEQLYTEYFVYLNNNITATLLKLLKLNYGHTLMLKLLIANLQM